MTLFITRAETVAGRQFELDSIDTDDQADARRRAIRVAELLSLMGGGGRWLGSRVSVFEAQTGRLVFVVRITRREVARHG